MSIDLTRGQGPLVVGEKPDPVAYTYKAADGTVMNLTGYTPKFSIREASEQAGTILDAAFDGAPTGGTVKYAWIGSEFSTPGLYLMEFWVGNGAQRYCSELMTAPVRAAVGAVPNI